MERISVFCGSSYGNNSLYEQKAYELGKYLADKNIELIYGGA
jgi:predicted Rossmann-fold nucleotide-binding protein